MTVEEGKDALAQEVMIEVILGNELATESPSTDITVLVAHLDNGGLIVPVQRKVLEHLKVEMPEELDNLTAGTEVVVLVTGPQTPNISIEAREDLDLDLSLDQSALFIQNLRDHEADQVSTWFLLNQMIAGVSLLANLLH